MKDKDFKLCYIEGNFAYFTTQSLKKQWGDDWNDAPYECNAGEPYTPTVFYYADGKTENDKRDWTNGKPNWEIQEVCFFSEMEAPCDIWNNGYSMSVSVEDINKKICPWLQTSKYEENSIKIWAGCSIEKFKKLVKKAGGKIYVEEENGM